MTDEHSPQDTIDKLIQRTSETKPPKRRRFPVWLMLVLVLVLIGGAALAYYLFAPLDAPIPDDAGAHTAGLDQGTTAQGFPRLGRADAPIVVEEFSSYACPHCRDFHLERFPGLLDEIAAGQVQFVLIPVPHIGIGAKSAAKAALCAGEQGQFWTMNDVLFDWQDRFVLFTFDERRLQKGADNLGLDSAAFEDCMGSRATETLIETARSEFDQRGLSGTPTFFINGDQVQDYSEFDHLGEPTETTI